MASIRETARGFDVLYRSTAHGRQCRNGCAKQVHQRSRTFTTRNDADKFKAAVEAGLDFGLTPEPTVLSKPETAPVAPSFRSATLDLIKRKGPRGDWSNATCIQYRSALRKHLGPLHESTVLEVANARAQVMAIAASAGAAPLFLIRAVCRDAINHGKLDGHRLGDIATSHHQRREIIPASREQLQLIADTLDAWRDGAGLLVWLGDGLGVRQGEALALRVSDFRNDYATVRITRQIARGQIAPLKAKRPGAYRDVPVSKLLATKVRQHVSELGLSPQSPLFAHRGQRYTAATVGEYFRDGAVAAGLPAGPNVRPAFTFHQLRHGFASRLLSAGVPISTVASYLGHSAQQTTEIYSHLLPDSDFAVRAILDAS